jgi:hypothetical protein
MERRRCLSCNKKRIFGGYRRNMAMSKLPNTYTRGREQSWRDIYINRASQVERDYQTRTAALGDKKT